jgi:hypothetical protein
VNSRYSSAVEKVLPYIVARPCQISSGEGENVLIASSKAFLVITTFQSVGLLVGDKGPSVMTSVNLSFTMVRMV